jgi:hypothetical protein
MTHITRRQAAAGLALLAISAATRAGQAARQHRPHHVEHPQQRPRPTPMPEKMERRTEMKQDRLLSQDRDRIRDQDMYGSHLMSAEERQRYRDRLQNAANDREWAQLRAEHQEEMQARARAQGVELEPPIYGQHMMTMEERNRFATRMQDARGETEREMIRNEHREFIRSRARELGMEPPPR